jgi:hypothetical protein
MGNNKQFPWVTNWFNTFYNNSCDCSFYLHPISLYCFSYINGMYGFILNEFKQPNEAEKYTSMVRISYSSVFYKTCNCTFITHLLNCRTLYSHNQMYSMGRVVQVNHQINWFSGSEYQSFWRLVYTCHSSHSGWHKSCWRGSEIHGEKWTLLGGMFSCSQRLSSSNKLFPILLDFIAFLDWEISSWTQLLALGTLSSW